MKILEFFGRTKKIPHIKKVAAFFLLLLIPNIIRQIIYYVAFLLTKSTDFIASPETRTYDYNIFPFMGIGQEIVIGFFYTYFWFKFRRLKFLSYAWINDALFDFISVFSWTLFGKTVLQLLGFGLKLEVLFREFLLFYVIVGPLMYIKKVNIYRLTLIYSLIGAFILIFVIFFNILK